MKENLYHRYKGPGFYPSPSKINDLVALNSCGIRASTQAFFGCPSGLHGSSREGLTPTPAQRRPYTPCFVAPSTCFSPTSLLLRPSQITGTPAWRIQDLLAQGLQYTQSAKLLPSAHKIVPTTLGDAMSRIWGWSLGLVEATHSLAPGEVGIYLLLFTCSLLTCSGARVKSGQRGGVGEQAREGVLLTQPLLTVASGCLWETMAL